MTPTDWNYALRPEVPPRAAHAVIAKHVRAHLVANVLAGDMVGTGALVEMLYPLAYAKQSDIGMAARDRIFKALTPRALGKYDLADCMSRGPEQKLGGSHFRGRPCLWHAPLPFEVPKCPHCGGELEF